jgi:hypothetical protein
MSATQVAELTQSEIGMERTLEEFLSWFDGWSDRFQDESYKEAFFRRRGTFKQFREEVYPFSIFARECLCGSAGRVKFSCDNSSHDVEIFSGNAWTKIEIAYAGNVYRESLQEEYFLKHGSVCLTGDTNKIVLSGPGRPYDLINENEARSHEEIVNEQINFVVERINKKTEKQYPVTHWLLVSFEDNHWRDADYKKMYEASTLAFEFGSFGQLILIGRVAQSVFKFG